MSSSVSATSSGSATPVGGGSPWLALLDRWGRLLLAIYWPALAAVTHWPRLTVGGGRAVWGSDKMLHFACFAFLTIFMIYAQLLGREAKWRHNILLGTFIAGFWAILDEFSQAHFGRTVSTSDLLANLAGVGAVFAAVAASPPCRSLRFALVWLCRIGLLGLGPIVFFQLFTKYPLTQFSSSRPYEWFGYTVRGDHFGHFLLGAGGVCLLYGAHVLGRIPRVVNALLAALPLLAVAPFIERLQSDVGREVDRWDMYGHAIGVGAGFVVCLGWIVLGRRIAKRLLPRRLDPSQPIDGNAKPSDSSHAFVGHAMLVSFLTLISRVTGLIRDAVIIAAFGLGAISDAFYLGFKIPNLFRRLFGEGALSAAFIPVYTEKLRQDPALARRLATVCLALQLVVLGAITALSEWALSLALAHGNWSDDTVLALRLTMVMLPYMPLVCAVAVMGGVLQVHRKFGAPAAAPILLNLTLIFFTIMATEDVHGDAPLRHSVMITAISVLLAGVFQVIWCGAAMLRVEGLSLGFRGVGKPMREILVMMLPMLAGLAVFQINAFADSLIAWLLSPKNGGDQITLAGVTFTAPIPEQGAVAALELAQRLYQFPLGVFGIAIATAIFPAFAHAAANTDDPDRNEFREILHRGLRLTVFIGLPAAAGLVLVRLPLVRLLFEYERFSLEDSQRVAGILTGYAIGVWAYSLTHVLTRAFYALKDVKTPLRVSVGMVFVNLAMNLTLVWFLGAAGLAWSTAICAALQSAILMMLIGRHLATPVSREVVTAWRMTLILTLLMAVVLVPIGLFHDAAAVGKRSAALLLGVQVALGVAVYLGGARVFRMQELGWLRSRRRGDA